MTTGRINQIAIMTAETETRELLNPEPKRFTVFGNARYFSKRRIDSIQRNFEGIKIPFKVSPFQLPPLTTLRRESVCEHEPESVREYIARGIASRKDRVCSRMKSFVVR